MEKKKNLDFIVPASFFKTTEERIDAPAPKQEPEAKEVDISEPVAVPTEAPEVEAKVENTPPAPTPKIHIKSPERRVSGLSLRSIKTKKAHENVKAPAINQEDLPKEKFSEADMQSHWNDFVQHLEDKGRKILASNLQTDVPKLKDEQTIWIELPNSTMKKEVEREQSLMMDYLKQKLNNHSISLYITVNEEVAKKFAFTPEEKYEKLREKNPAIDMLRQEFDLDF